MLHGPVPGREKDHGKLRRLSFEDGGVGLPLIRDLDSDGGGKQGRDNRRAMQHERAPEPRRGSPSVLRENDGVAAGHHLRDDEAIHAQLVKELVLSRLVTEKDLGALAVHRPVHVDVEEVAQGRQPQG